MNTPLVIANILIAGAFFIHTFVGDKELRLIQIKLKRNERSLFIPF